VQCLQDYARTGGMEYEVHIKHFDRFIQCIFTAAGILFRRMVRYFLAQSRRGGFVDPLYDVVGILRISFLFREKEA
jgi:hypothetical protein